MAYLRRQQNFISKKRSQCPLICGTRWLNTMKVTTCFDKPRLAVVAYLYSKAPACQPDETWWILLLVVHEIACISAISCQLLQRYSTLLCSQHHTLVRLVDEISHTVGVVDRLSHSQCAAMDIMTHVLSESGNYAVTFSAVLGFMEDIDAFVKDDLTAMEDVFFENLLQFSASALV